MYPVSERFLEAVVQSHLRVSQVELLNNGVSTMTIPITEGHVTVDADAAVRRQCSVVIEGREDLVPDSSSDVLFPRVNEMKIWSGVDYEDGTDPELVPLGVFRVGKHSVDADNSGVKLSIDGIDRSDRVAGNKVTRPYVVPKGQEYWLAIYNVIKTFDPRAKFNFNPVGYRTPQIIFDIGADPWDEAQKMATAVGHELFLDVNGLYTLRPQPDPSEDPVATVWLEGELNPVTAYSRELAGEYGYNHVAIRSVNSDSEEGPVIAEAWDSNPSSPTYAGSPPGSSDYGLVTYFASSPFIATRQQAQAWADSTLLRVLGAGETVSGTIVPNPALDASDIVSAQYSPAKVFGEFVLKTLDIPLGSGEMSFAAGRRQIR